MAPATARGLHRFKPPIDAYREGSTIIGESHQLTGCRLHMTNIGKTLVIAVVLLDLGLVSYLLFPKHERDPATAEAEVGASRPALPVGVDSRFDDAHIAAGSVRTTPSAANTASVAATPRPSVVANVAPQVANVAPEPAPAARGVTPAPRPDAQPQATAPAPAPVQAQAPVQPQPQSQPQPQPAYTAQSKVSKQPLYARAAPVPRDEHARDDLHRSGSNPVAAAMTDQLVRESAKLDPALPPPLPGDLDGLRHRRLDPVGAAMTDQLVRESARVGPAPQQPAQPGTQ